MARELNPKALENRIFKLEKSGGAGGGMTDGTLGLSTNTDGDPIINLSYTQGEEVLNSPVAFDKSQFKIENNHMKLVGGGGGTSDYADLINKPTLEGETLEGDMTYEDLGIASAEDLAQTNEDLTEVSNRINDIAFYISNEILIGKFFDLNLYRKCYALTITSSMFSDITTGKRALIDLNIADKIDVIKCELIANNDSYAYATDHYTANNDYFNLLIDKTNKKIDIRWSGTYPTLPLRAYVTLEYLKVD